MCPDVTVANSVRYGDLPSHIGDAVTFECWPHHRVAVQKTVTQTVMCTADREWNQSVYDCIRKTISASYLLVVSPSYSQYSMDRLHSGPDMAVCPTSKFTTEISF